MEHGFRVRLEAPIDQLVDRLRADTTTPRPLLGGDLEGGLKRTAEARADVYAAVDAVVDSSGDVGSVADAVISATANGEGWRPLLDARYARNHPIGPAEGRLLMGFGLTGFVLTEAFGSGTPAVIADRAAIDANPTLAAALPSKRMCVMDGGEQAKTMAGLERLLTWLSEINLERSESAGRCGWRHDRRSRRARRRPSPAWRAARQRPTTWLAQADSSIGGKVAIDLPLAKNGVGAFWPASLIVEDADVLATLPVDRRRDGMAECLKAGLIGDALLWQLVEERGVAALNGDDPAAAYAITERAVRVKLDIVDSDPFETGERRKLNLGHTIGHALEIESGYTLAHGQAVALGLRAVANIAARRGAQVDLAERIDSVLSALGFDMTRQFDRGAVIAATATRQETGARACNGGSCRWPWARSWKSTT